MVRDRLFPQPPGGVGPSSFASPKSSAWPPWLQGRRRGPRTPAPAPRSQSVATREEAPPAPFPPGRLRTLVFLVPGADGLSPGVARLDRVRALPPTLTGRHGRGNWRLAGGTDGPGVTATGPDGDGAELSPDEERHSDGEEGQEEDDGKTGRALADDSVRFGLYVGFQGDFSCPARAGQMGYGVRPRGSGASGAPPLRASPAACGRPGGRAARTGVGSGDRARYSWTPWSSPASGAGPGAAWTIRVSTWWMVMPPAGISSREPAGVAASPPAGGPAARWSRSGSSPG